ncbi:hypothetical protein BDW62DRAFT_136235 [Aspergillus aurantiobrunneus]
MKSSILTLLPVLPATYAWTFTWRNAAGDATTERGSGPSECVVVDHAEGQLFEMDGEGEENINMLLFTNDECAGEPSGMATVEYTREASSDLRGFQVVSTLEDDETTTSATADETDETFTLPTEAPTNGTSSAAPTTTGTETATGTISDEPTETPSPTETDSDAGASATPDPTNDSGEDEPAPTDASAKLVLSRTGLAGVVVAVLAGLLF